MPAIHKWQSSCSSLHVQSNPQTDRLFPGVAVQDRIIGLRVYMANKIFKSHVRLQSLKSPVALGCGELWNGLLFSSQ
jgi:hypothetical protein